MLHDSYVPSTEPQPYLCTCMGVVCYCENTDLPIHRFEHIYTSKIYYQVDSAPRALRLQNQLYNQSQTKSYTSRCRRPGPVIQFTKIMNIVMCTRPISVGVLNIKRTEFCESFSSRTIQPCTKSFVMPERCPIDEQFVLHLFEGISSEFTWTENGKALKLFTSEILLYDLSGLTVNMLKIPLRRITLDKETGPIYGELK